MREASTFGFRKSDWSRRILSREFKLIQTDYGKISVKVGLLEDEIIKIYPEYEDVKKAANQYNVPFAEVYLAVQKEAMKQLKSKGISV